MFSQVLQRAAGLPAKCFSAPPTSSKSDAASPRWRQHCFHRCLQHCSPPCTAPAGRAPPDGRARRPRQTPQNDPPEGPLDSLCRPDRHWLAGHPPVGAAGLALLAATYDRPVYLDVALVPALLSFAGRLLPGTASFGPSVEPMPRGGTGPVGWHRTSAGLRAGGAPQPSPGFWTTTASRRHSARPDGVL
ncbi:MrpF/PhaF family protein [Spirillospora sp. NPDC048819]|uniref:MrpF/PhaF family protein n=1 Tax=Spirillospora sp. NPDC048819 TaxID=3155268 RepID=UPI0033E323A4